MMGRQGVSACAWRDVRSPAAGGELVSLTVVATEAIEAEPGAAEVYRAVGRWLDEHNIQVLQERVFAQTRIAPLIQAVRRDAFSAFGADPEVPYTHAGYHPCVGGAFAGLQILGVSGAVRGETIRDKERSIGRLAEGPGERALFLAQLRGRGEPRAEGSVGSTGAIEQMYDSAAAIMARHGFGFRDVARTWIYLEDLLGCYAELNRVRNAWFEREGLPSSDGRYSYPASTGIQGGDPSGAACYMDIVAATSADGSGPLHGPIASPRQCPAPAYGSAFSRGVQLSLFGAHLVYLSGTASIDADGETRYVGDPGAQIEWTCEAADAVLRAAGAGLSQAATGVVYFKNAAAYAEWLRRERVNASGVLPPMIAVYSDVCRRDLLFEVEASCFVVRARPPRAAGAPGGRLTSQARPRALTDCET